MALRDLFTSRKKPLSKHSSHAKPPVLENLDPRLLLSSLGAVDFSGPEIQATDIAVTTGPGFAYNNYYGDSWRMLYPGYSGFSAKFWLDAVRPVDMEVTHLSSAAAGAPGGGYSPVDIGVNGWLFWDNYDVADNHGGSHGFEADTFTLPASLLQHGWNEIVFAFEDDPWASTHYWIQRMELDLAAPTDEAWADFSNLSTYDPAEPWRFFNDRENFYNVDPAMGAIASNPSGDSLVLYDAGNSFLETSFWLDSITDIELTVRHLTSSNLGSGFAPVDFIVNDGDGDPFNETNLLLNDYDVAQNHNGSHGLETDTFWIPATMLQLGWNDLAIAYEDDTSDPIPITHYWINQLHMHFGGDAPEPEPQFPDLAILAGDVALVSEGGQQRVQATVRNIGDLTADNVVLRFREVETGVEGITIIPSIPSGGSVSVSSLWSPSSPGAHIEVKVDPFDEIEEVTNSNNRAVAQYDPAGGEPIITVVVAEWDGDGDSYRFGRYVSDIPNTFAAGVIDPDGAANIDHVTFTLGPLGSQTDSNPSDGWSADFDMGALSSDAALTVVAYDEQGNSSDAWTGAVHVVDFPSWIGTPGGDDYFDRGWYYFNGLFPEFMEQWFTMPTEMYGIPIPIIGGTRSGFRAGIESTVIASLSTRSDPYRYLEFVAYAEVFDQTLLDVRYTPEYQSDYFSLSVSDYDINRDSLRLEGFDVTAELTELPLGSFNTPEYPIFGAGVPVLADITLRASAGIEATLDAGLMLHFDGSGISVVEAWLEPDITGRGSLIGAGRVLGFDLARAQGSLELVLSPELRYSGGDWHPSLTGTMRIPWEVSVGYGWLSYTWDGVIPDETGWVFNWGDVEGDVAATALIGATAASSESVLPVRPMLSADQDSAGNTMLVRVVDDGDATAPNGNIYYAYRSAGGSWTSLQPLALSSQSLGSPVVAMDGQGGALAVWVANDLPNDGSATPSASDLFKHQDIYAAYFDGSNWSTPMRITNDTYADGQPALACDPTTGDAILLWTRSELADATDRTGFEIAYAEWDHATLSWSFPALLTTDITGDWSPQVAYNDASQAMAVWTRDTGGSLATREQAYAIQQGGSWSGIATSFVSGGASEGAVVSAPDGSFVVACVREAEAHEQLMTATFDPTSGLWRPAELIAEGQIIQEPRLAVNTAGVATLVWQTTGGDGRSDLAAAIRDLAGGGAWASAGNLTDSDEIEWMPVLLFDDVGDAQYIYELPESIGGGAVATGVGSVPSLGTGVGDGETDLLPDLTVQRLYFADNEVIESEGVRLATDVYNIGWGDAGETEVQFYLGDPNSGGTPLGNPVLLPALVPGGSVTSLMSDVFTLPGGANEYYAIATPVTGETSTLNNSISMVQESSPPDITGPIASIELLPGNILSLGTETIVLRFSESINGLTESDISCVEDQLGTIIPDHVFVDYDARSAELIFEGGLPMGSYTFKILDSVTDLVGNYLDGNNDGIAGGDYELSFEVSPAVVGRCIFYNNSAWDGGDPLPNAADDGAIATDKQALLPGGTATFANYTAYGRGVNGVMVDIDGLANPGGLGTADFVFEVSEWDEPATWGGAPAPSVTVREGAGTGGSDRVTIIWADSAIRDQWLKVTVLATANTGLAAEDVFQFGNLVGDFDGSGQVRRGGH